MTKRGANYKTWRKRYFILIPDGFLIYFKESDDLHHPLGIIYLHGAFLDRLTAEQCERNRPHSFVVRSTTRRFVLCTESSSDKEIWIKNIERVISQLNIRMKMAADSRISVSTRASNADFYLSSSPPRPNGMAMIDPAELKSIDREIVTLDKKISDCILHANSFESRIPNAPSYIDAEDEMESTMRTSNATNIYGSNGGGVSVVVAEASNKQDVSSRSNNKKGKKSSNNDSDEEDTDDVDDNEDQRSDSNDEESSEEEDEEESEESDEEPAPQPKSRKRQNTLKSKSKRVSSLEKLNADLDNLLTVFVKMNNYLLTIDKQREQTEKDIKELKSHKKLLVKEVKNLREKLKK